MFPFFFLSLFLSCLSFFLSDLSHHLLRCTTVVQLSHILSIIFYIQKHIFIATTSHCLCQIEELKKFLCQHFEMKDLGLLSHFLGLEVLSLSDGLFLSQTKHVSDLVSRVGLTDCKIEHTPLEPNIRFTPQDGTLLDDATLYRKLVGSLIYLTITRPYISYDVYLVSQFMASPRTTHYVVVLRIIRYINGSLFYGLHYSATSSLILRAYSNADWVGDPSDRRSTIGFCIFLGDSIISWGTTKQTLTARSYTESKYHALADTTYEILWLRCFLADLETS